MRTLSVVFGFVFLLPKLGIGAPEIDEQAERAFSERKYAAALAIYEKRCAEGPARTERDWRSCLRGLEAEAALLRFDRAAKRSLTLEAGRPPAPWDWKLALLSAAIEVQADHKDRAIALYEKLRAMRVQLKDIAAGEMAPFLSSLDHEDLPTAWDLVVSQYARFLESQSQGLVADGALEKLYQEAAQSDGPNEGRERWATELELLPFDSHDAPAPLSEDALSEEDPLLPRLTKLRAFADGLESERLRARIAGVLAREWGRRGKLELSLDTCGDLAGIRNIDSSVRFSEQRACFEIVREMRRPVLEILLPKLLASKRPSAVFRTRGLSKIKIRLHTIPAQKIAQSDQIGFYGFRSLSEKLAKELLATSAVFSRDIPIDADKLEIKETPWTFPAIESGFYVLSAESWDPRDPAGRIVVAARFHATELALFAQAGRKHENRVVVGFQSVDADSGLPVKSSIEISSRSQYGSPEKRRVTTRTDGSIEAEYSEKKAESESWDFDAVARREGALEQLALWGQPLYFQKFREPERALWVDTDRALYRPNQIVHVRFVLGSPTRRKVVARGKIEFRVHGPDGTIWKEGSAITLDSGSAEVSFAAQSPALGTSILRAWSRGQEILEAEIPFQIEAYQLPLFEVKWDPGKKSGEPNTVTGTAKYFTQAPIRGAEVRYRILEVLPWDLRGQGHRPLATGSVGTNPEGRFEIPLPTSLGRKGRLLLRVEADIISTAKERVSSSFLVPTRQDLPTFKAKRNLYEAGEAAEFFVDSTTIRTEEVPVEISKLNALTTGTLVYQGKLRPEAKVLSVPGLSPGKYEIRVSGGEPLSFFVIARTKPGRVRAISEAELSVQNVSVVEQPTLAVGATARVLLGSSSLTTVFVDVWRGDERLTHERLDGGLVLLRLPIRKEWVGDATGTLRLRWYGCRHHQIQSGEVLLPVSEIPRRLIVRATGPQEALPGSFVDWELRAETEAGKPADGELGIRVVDRALETLRGGSGTLPFSTSNLATRSPSDLATSEVSTFALELQRAPEPAVRLPEPRPLPKFRFQNDAFSHTRIKALEMSMEMDAPMAMAAPAGARAKSASPPPAPASPVRSEFRETACWSAHVKLRHGKAKVRCRLPDSLTEWSLYAKAHTPDLRFGEVSLPLVARKEVMVRWLLPSFVREQDFFEGTALVQNTGDKSQKVRLQLELELAGKVLGRKTFRFDVASKSQSEQTLSVKIPTLAASSTEGTLWRAAVFTDTKTPESLDSEIRSLPRHPAFAIVARSEASPLREAPVTLNLEKKNKVEEIASVVEIYRESAETWVETLRELQFAEVSDAVDAIAGRWLLAHAIRKYPLSGASSANTTKQNNRLVSEKDPRLLVSSTGALSVQSRLGVPTADLPLDYAALEQLLVKAQNSDGGFSWFPGTQSDLFFTLRVLARVAEAKTKLGLSPPAWANQAVMFASRELLEKEGELRDLSLPTWGWHTLLQFESLSNTARERAARTTELRSDEEAVAASELVLLAETTRALNGPDEKKAKLLFERAFDSMQTDPRLGNFWMPEPNSSQRDTIESQAILLNSLHTQNANDSRIPGVLRWLLWSRKATTWTESSTISALLAVLPIVYKPSEQKVQSTYQVSWGAEKKTWNPNALGKRWKWVRERPTPSRVTFAKTGKTESLVSITRVERVQRSENVDGPGLRVRRTLAPSTKVGEPLDIEYRLQSDTPLAYVVLRAPRPAGVEPESYRSEWMGGNVPHYRQTRDGEDTFYFLELPAGETRIQQKVFGRFVGEFQLQPATLQSVYTPDLVAHTADAKLGIKKLPK